MDDDIHIQIAPFMTKFPCYFNLCSSSNLALSNVIQYNHTKKITSLALCQSEKYLQNSLIVLSVSQQYCTIICYRHAAKNAITPATLTPAHTPCVFLIDPHTAILHLMIALILLLLIPFETPFPMMSGVSHHCHHLRLI